MPIMSSVQSRDCHNHLLFECAWEVCNAVGGVYTVVKTKVPITVAEYGDRYCLIGPLSLKAAALEVEEIQPPADSPMAKTLESMRAQGVKVMYARWLIEGNPKVLLFDTGSAYHRLDEWKGDLWNAAGIPTPSHDTETNDAVVFGYLVAWFLGEYVHHEQSRAIIAHFHEWQVGVAIPLIRKRRLDLVTIFTTHATLLGRYLCAGSLDFYNSIKSIDVDHEAGKRGIYHRYCIERAATHSSDVFTTPSHITAWEAEHLLKRKPDGILPNGLNVKKFQAMHEFQNLHSVAKGKINEFVKGHFYGHMGDIDLDNTLYFFTAGRYEYRNKGADMFIEALARLNYRLQKMGSKITVIAFIVMPAATHSYTVESLRANALSKQLQESIAEVQARVGQRLYDHAMNYTGEHGTEIPDVNTLLSSEDKILLKRRMYALKRNGLPPIVTHNMADDSTDPILNQLRRVQLFNRGTDRVKVIFHPEFLNSNNPVLPLDYDEFVRGCNLGVFPSYYEPWGYTPAEATLCGVSSITTNLSGFGCFMEELIESPQDYGIYIVDRRMKSIEESVEQLVDQMVHFCQKTRRQRINQRNRTERLSDLLDWRSLGLEYAKARQLALRRAYPDAFADDEFDFSTGTSKISAPFSCPGTPTGSGAMTPGQFGTLTEEMQYLQTDDYHGAQIWNNLRNGAVPRGDEEEEDEENEYPFALSIKRRRNPQSGQSTPGREIAPKGLTEGDLQKADAKLSLVI